MSNPYVGEIRMFAGTFAPVNWMFCNGQLLPISEYETLFNLIGTTYGGDGQQTFALPDLRGRLPVHAGTNPATGSPYVIGQAGGVETVTLTPNQIPLHTHVPECVSGPGNEATPAGGVWAASGLDQFSSNAPNANLSQAALASAGGGQPHDNLMPYLTVSFIISLFGIFPAQN